MKEKNDSTFSLIDIDFAVTDLLLRISVELMGLKSKLATYLESALKSDSTYMCSKLFCRHFYFLKNSLVVAS